MVIVTENLPKLMKDAKPQIQEAEGTPAGYIQKNYMKHTILKLPKIKDRKY